MPEMRSTVCTDPVTLPVAVHYQGLSNPDVQCLRNLAQAQIDILNADFQGENSDINQWTNNASSSFPGVEYGKACFELCLATTGHPSGFGISSGDPAVTVNATNGDSDNSWSGYINIFVRSNTGVLGYSPLGGSGNGDGVVVDAAAFGAGAGCNGVQPQAPYNLGRTLTHELGHYLLLDHIWGNGGCNSDDQVGDTPNANDSYGGCPSIGAASCGSTDMHMNYMDYTNDACMYMFTLGQMTRSENYINSSLQSVIAKGNQVCSGNTGGGGGGTGTDPTCNDGIQNGDETGVDCGGSNCPPCDAPPSNCEMPTGFDVQADENSALITWNEVAGATTYRVRYRELGTTQWFIENTVVNEVILNALQANTTYEFRVRAMCADGIYSTWSPKASFTTQGEVNPGGGNDCDFGTQVDLELTLDDYGSETSWYLVDDFTYEILAAGGPYQDGQNGANISETWCLEDGCYFFIIFDEYGDGICCDYGEGSYAILDGDGFAVAESDGYFGDMEFVDFCIEAGEINVFEFRKAMAQGNNSAARAKGEKAKKRSINQIKLLRMQLK